MARDSDKLYGAGTSLMLKTKTIAPSGGKGRDSPGDDLKDSGLKATLPRLKVLEVIRSSASRHLSAEDIYRRLVKQGTEVSLGTVYRVLTQLEAAGLLLRNVFDSGKAIFEINEGGHHDHLICLACGRVDEFKDQMTESRQRAIATAHGFQLTEHRLVLYGLCAKCSVSSPAKPNNRDIENQ